MSVHQTYREAFETAQNRADATGREIGLRKSREYGREVFTVFALPAMSHRYGEDLRAQVVAPTITTQEET